MLNVLLMEQLAMAQHQEHLRRAQDERQLGQSARRGGSWRKRLASALRPRAITPSTGDAAC